MNIGLVLELLKVSLDVFQAERRDRFLKKYVKLEKEYYEEMAKPYFNPLTHKGKKYDASKFRSDYAYNRILRECETLTKLVISEQRSNSN